VPERAAVLAMLSAGGAILRRQGGSLRLWLGHRQRVWWLEGYRDRLNHLTPIDGPADLPAAITGWLGSQPSPRDPTLRRARALVDDAQQALDAVTSGAWLPLSEASALAHHEGIGFVRFGTGDPPGWISLCAAPLATIAPVLWSAPAEAVPPAGTLAPVLSRLSAVLGRVERGESILVVGGQVLAHCAGRWLQVRLEDGRFDTEKLLNPWTSVLERERVVEQVLQRRLWSSQRFGEEPLSAVLRADFAGLSARLEEPREAIIQRYLAHLRGGGHLSGGPTTDQSWTVRWTDSGLTISSYEGEGRDMRPVTHPLSEASLRRMLEQYRMFGLYQMG